MIVTIGAESGPQTLGNKGVSIVARGMTGTAETLVRDPTATRGGPRDELARAAALSEGSFAIIENVAVNLQSPPVLAAEEQTRGADGDGSISLRVASRAETGYAVLFTDQETGVRSWVFGAQSANDASSLDFPLPPPQVRENPDESTAERRGIVTKSMRGIAKIVAWAVDPLIGSAANAIASQWESRRRPYGIRQVTPDGQCIEPDWSHFSEKPALLLLHGTFSTPDAFHGWFLGESFRETLARYEGRCLAFAHPTLSEGPDTNVEWLLKNLPAAHGWCFDIVSHSRGGLVARSLACQSGSAVRRMVLVASPNYGTKLADAKYWTTFLDAHTNLLTSLPDGFATILAEGILCFVKIVGSGAAKHLEGLAAMNASTPFLKELGSRKPAQPIDVFAVSSHFQPPNIRSLKQLLLKGGDLVVEEFFSEPNDLVVPTLGCSQGQFDAAGFPVAPGNLLALEGMVNHCTYFEDDEVQSALRNWLIA
jgi:pimeloyl-ACP methyl ester carboxylesterase